MKSETKSQNKALYVLLVLVGALIVGLLAGCGTVTPVQVVSTTHSWDGTAQNSGFIGWTTNGCGIITPHARDRYNALIVKYGHKFNPPLGADYGVTPSDDIYIITPEALSDFATMNRWHKSQSY